jgi:hypothetical protein
LFFYRFAFDAFNAFCTGHIDPYIVFKCRYQEVVISRRRLKTGKWVSAVSKGAFFHRETAARAAIIVDGGFLFMRDHEIACSVYRDTGKECGQSPVASM